MAADAAGDAVAAAAAAAMLLAPPPRRRLDAVGVEKLEDIVIENAGERRSLIKSRMFPELTRAEVAPSSVEVVLFDQYSMDSFAACFAARAALGSQATYHGVSRNSRVEDLEDAVQGRVVAMLGICWPMDAMHDLVLECSYLFVLCNHVSVQRELEQFTYPQALSITDTDMGACTMAWNLFHPNDPPPALFRAIEDAELGRGLLRNAAAFEAAIDEGCLIGDLPRGEVPHGDKAFETFKRLLGSDGGRAAIQTTIEEGLLLLPIIAEQSAEVVGASSVATLCSFPAWRCSLAEVREVSTQHAGAVADALARDLRSRYGGVATSDGAGDEEEIPATSGSRRCFGAAYEFLRSRVRVVLRSLHGGPDVSEIAAQFDGCGHRTRAFFSVDRELWDGLWVRPETVLWDVPGGSPGTLAVAHGEAVVVARRGERFMDSPFDEWSWCYRCEKPTVEGWVPTLAHTIWVATQSADSPGDGVQATKEGDLVYARGQRGQYLYGRRFRQGCGDAWSVGWFSKEHGGLVDAGSVERLRPPLLQPAA
eukprot:TRINITY_DN6640_c0_g5_i1.p1 TRINITY_DN6640_c0_g5~~TRINITY_DN6640_c0_g5_i1.p1  ORF type:complete len:548 (-),score=105.98 TRINITY_DN6640_c0_g5_i1:224-1831(-)